MIYLDAHVVAWLYAGKLKLIPEKIQKKISAEELLISPVVTLELQYLFEVGRVTEEGNSVVHDLVNRIGLKVDELPGSVKFVFQPAEEGAPPGEEGNYYRSTRYLQSSRSCGYDVAHPAEGGRPGKRHSPQGHYRC